MKYIVVRSANGRCPFSRVEFCGKSSFIEAMRKDGFEMDGIEERQHLLPWLIGQPRFRGFHGPMAERDAHGPIVRYEDWAVSKLLSA